MGDLRRFENEDQFSAYIGMIPAVRISGSTESTIGISPRGKSLFRSYLIEAAWVAVRRDPEMQSYYRNTLERILKMLL